MSVSVSLVESGAGSAQSPRCLVEGVLDFTTASEALERVTPHITNHESLTIDLSGVSRANSAGLALIIEWLAAGRRSGHTVTFHHIPDGLRQLAGVCQVDGLI